MAKRNILEVVELIKNERFENIINSDLSVNLLWAYSQLFLNGIEPSWCAKCMKRYYQEIILKGTEMAINLNEAKNRTCIPKWNGLKYIQKAGRHYDNVYITDGQVIELLKGGLIDESDFTKLPDGYNKVTPVGFIPEIKKVDTEINVTEKIILDSDQKNSYISKNKKAKK